MPAETIFAKDRVGIEKANAMLAILDGPAIDDGTASETGMFHALIRSPPRGGALSACSRTSGEWAEPLFLLTWCLGHAGTAAGSRQNFRAHSAT